MNIYIICARDSMPEAAFSSLDAAKTWAREHNFDEDDVVGPFALDDPGRPTTPWWIDEGCLTVPRDDSIVHTPLAQSERYALRHYADTLVDEDWAIGVLIESAVWNIERLETRLAAVVAAALRQWLIAHSVKCGCERPHFGRCKWPLPVRCTREQFDTAMRLVW